MSIRGIKLSDTLKLAFGIIITLMLSIGTYGFNSVTTLEARVTTITETYAKNKDIKFIHDAINRLSDDSKDFRKDMRSMLETLRKEIRYDRRDRTNRE